MEQFVPTQEQRRLGTPNRVSGQVNGAHDGGASIHWCPAIRSKMTREEFWAIEHDERRRTRQIRQCHVCQFVQTLLRKMFIFRH